jgi:crossover junction endodeoxyribonuclease RuvC
MTHVVGIDPGISGAIGLLVNGQFVRVEDMPLMQRGPSSEKQMVNDVELARILREMAPHVVVVELVNGMPANIGGRKVKIGSAALFNFGDCAGVVRGVLGGIGLERHFVVPRVWKKRAGLSGTNKEASRALAINHWPAAPLSRKKDSGRAEALLIARYGLNGVAS